MVDWGAGSYERTATELEPVARLVVERAEVAAEDRVVDLACGTGNAALLAAQRGARVIGVDGAPRLLEVARDRAARAGLEVELRGGDLLNLPLEDGSADVVLSVFGVIFAEDPEGALREIARVAAPGARILLTAWIPGGPIDAMLTAAGRVVARATGERPPDRFPWSVPLAVGELALRAGLALHSTHQFELPIRDLSPGAYIAAGREHPMAVAVRPALERAGSVQEAEAAMLASLEAANEDPAAFLIHSPYVVHELGAVPR